MTRLQRYRAFLAAMNPSSDPKLALERGYYIDPPDGGVWSKLTKRLELDPASTHLVLGGIGSGKTSELLRTKQRLEESGHLVAYRDVSESHDLATARESGILLALTGKWLAHPLSADEADAWATASALLQDEYADLIERCASQHSDAGRSILMLFDSLDRLPQTAHFKTLIVDDVRALKSAGVGVVIVGPARFMVGHDRSVTDSFDHVYFQLATDPSTPQGREFLIRVLRQRSDSDDLLSDECLPALARASGGVLRDLIALTKLSAEEAYANGHAQITAEDVARASDAFGRSLALGLDDEQLEILETVANSGSFVIRGERELSLLETRRVLMYHPRPGEVSNRWAVHPTLLELMTQLTESRS